MIPSIPQQGPMHPMAHRRGANGPEMPSSATPTPVAGKATAPGQIAKTMIAEATETGAELPADIQGKAASAIARGMNMEAFFASFMPAVEPPATNDSGDDSGDVSGDISGDGEIAPPGDDGADAIPEPGSEIPEPEGSAASLPAPDLDDETTVAVESSAANSYEIAAALLEPLEELGTASVV